MDRESLLVATVAAVGILHTLVPDHWAPIVILARRSGWSAMQTARTAALAGFGHAVTTLILGALVWAAGAALAVCYAHLVSIVSASALIAFGLWIAYSDWREMRHAGRGHEHHHSKTERLALPLILGSSPMIEGIPPFLSASTRGPALLAVMGVVFAIATIVTYVALSIAGLRGLERTSFRPIERYGEVLSGLFVAAVGIYALFTS